MLTSITPLGERGRGQRYAVTLTAYLLGSAAGGAAVGAALAALGGLLPLPAPARLALGAALCVLAAVVELSGRRVPSGGRQVDEDWLTRYRGWVYGAGFGVQLGLAVCTVVTSAATYAFLGLALLAGTWTAGLAVGAAFGVARGLPALALRGATSHDRLVEGARRLEALARPASRVTAGVLLLSGAGLTAAAL